MPFRTCTSGGEDCREACRQEGSGGASAPGITNKPFKEKMKSDEEFKKKNEELQEHLTKAKEQYSYKYSSP